MTKDLEKEYLEDLDHYDEGMGIHSTSYKRCKERLIRLAKIDSASPSEAVNSLNKLWDTFICSTRTNEKYVEDNPFVRKHVEDYGTIKATLLKAEKLEKAWEILKKSLGFNFYSKTREVEIYDLTDEEDYCFLTNKDDGSSLLTQEEFELIKEMLE